MRGLPPLFVGLCVVIGLVPAGASAATIPGKYIVVLKDSVGSPDSVARDHGRRFGVARSHVYRYALRGYAAAIPAEKLGALKSDERVRFVAPDATVEATAKPSLPCLSSGGCLPRGIDRVDADSSSALAGNGSGSVNVNVAILDTGTDASHPDLTVSGGTSCVDDKNTNAYPGGHGTHVGGTVGALDNGFGVVGVAPGARLSSVQVLSSKSGSIQSSRAEIICGIDWVTSTRTDADPTNDIAVANMSLGGEGADDGNCGQTNSDAEHMAICASTAAGVTYVVSAGNFAGDFRDFVPAAYDEVLTVTAVADFDGAPGGLDNTSSCDYKNPDPDDWVARFSAFATLGSDAAHTVAAPGVCILSTWPVSGAHEKPFLIASPGYAFWQGTSMASPHVAGTVALCIASGPCAGLTPAQIIPKIVADATAYNAANPTYGFQGDPLRPIAGKYYGYLVRAGLY
jgi:subtilisin family serine protease